MKLFELIFTDGTKRIIFAESAEAAKAKYSGVWFVYQIDIVN